MERAGALLHIGREPGVFKENDTHDHVLIFILEQKLGKPALRQRFSFRQREGDEAAA